MTITTLSSREFQQNVNKAQKAAQNGPVCITNRCQTAHVLLSYEEYHQITGGGRSLVKALSMPGLGETDLDIPRTGALPRPADSS